MSAREELAAVLAEHQRRADRSGACLCGEWPPPNFGVPWTDHVADALLGSPALANLPREAKAEALRTWATRAGGVASRARRSEFTRGVIAATEHARDVADEIATRRGRRNRSPRRTPMTTRGDLAAAWDDGFTYATRLAYGGPMRDGDPNPYRGTGCSDPTCTEDHSHDR